MPGRKVERDMEDLSECTAGGHQSFVLDMGHERLGLEQDTGSPRGRCS